MARRKRGGRLAWVFIGVMLIFAGTRYFETLQDQGVRRPQITPQEEASERRPKGPPLPGRSMLDPTAEVEMKPCEEACTGAAFAIDDKGHWLTAQHVVDDCRQVGLLRGRRIIKVNRVESHPRADVSMLWTDITAPPLALSSAALNIGQDGFHFGFPGSEPGAVHGRLMGRMHLRATGQHRFVAPAISWAEVARRPEREGGLGGLSGGAVLNNSGQVIGVAVASSHRRGRVISAAPASLEEMIDLAGLSRAKLPRQTENPRSIDAGGFAKTGEALRSKLTVAQVICVGRKAERRRNIF